MADITETGLPRAVAIAWGMHEVPQRGPSRGLSHERIVAAAVQIADDQGLSAVTMQAVAQSLGFTTMSLYRYVSSKDELLRLMLDAGTTVPPKAEVADDWRHGLRDWAGLIRSAYRTHPWLLEIPRGQISVLMPNTVRMADLGLAAMQGLDLDDDTKIAVILIISQHVAATVALERSLGDEDDVAVSPEGMDMLAGVITPQRYPHLAPVLQAGHYVVEETSEAETDDVDVEFNLGLDLIITGLEVMQARRQDPHGTAEEASAADPPSSTGENDR